MKPNAGSSAVKTASAEASAALAAAKAVRESEAGLTTSEVGTAIGRGVRRTKAVLTIACAAGLICYVRSLGSYVWMTPKKAAAYRSKASRAAKAVKRERARLREKEQKRVRRSRAKGLPPQPRVVPSFEFGLTDQELKDGRRSWVAANEALPIKSRPVRWVFDLGRAA